MTATRRQFSVPRCGCFGIAILAINLAGVAGPSMAQAPPPSPQQPESQIPDKIAPPIEDCTDQKKLQRDNGAIKPRDNVDPGMTAKPPSTGGRMPVIPPPGSPGGDPTVHPK